jgi:hypothetical protein
MFIYLPIILSIYNVYTPFPSHLDSAIMELMANGYRANILYLERNIVSFATVHLHTLPDQCILTRIIRRWDSYMVYIVLRLFSHLGLKFDVMDFVENMWRGDDPYNRMIISCGSRTNHEHMMMIATYMKLFTTNSNTLPHHTMSLVEMVGMIQNYRTSAIHLVVKYAVFFKVEKSKCFDFMEVLMRENRLADYCTIVAYMQEDNLEGPSDGAVLEID